MSATEKGSGDDKNCAAAARGDARARDMHDEQRQSDKAPGKKDDQGGETRSRHCTTARVNGTCMTSDGLDEATKRRQ